MVRCGGYHYPGGPRREGVLVITLVRSVPPCPENSKLSFRSGHSILRACPREDQAGCPHAISPISSKLGKLKGFYPKLKRPKWFRFWKNYFQVRPIPIVFWGKIDNFHQNIWEKLTAVLSKEFIQFDFPLEPILVYYSYVYHIIFESHGWLVSKQRWLDVHLVTWLF